MSSYIWLFSFLPLLIIFLMDKKNKNYMIYRQILNRKKGKENKEMEELIKKFIGKDCLIRTVNTQYAGIIEEVISGGVLIKESEREKVINIDFVTSVEEIPLNKKGKRKSIY